MAAAPRFGKDKIILRVRKGQVSGQARGGPGSPAGPGEVQYEEIRGGLLDTLYAEIGKLLTEAGLLKAEQLSKTEQYFRACIGR